MNLKLGIIFICLGFGLFVSCMSDDEQAYIDEIQEWRDIRLDSLKGKTGWLNLAGLYWLEEGVNTFGSDESSRVVFPSKAPPQLGVFVRSGDSITMIVNSGLEVNVGAQNATDSVLLFDGDSIQRLATYESLNWFIIKRGKEVGVRLRDYEHPLIDEINEIDAYPISPEWRVEAKWEPYDPPKALAVPNQVGMVIELQAHGAFHFELLGVNYTLEPVGEPANGDYFLMIYDETSGHETYGSGRYIYVPEPNKEGITFIDFNKAYNPPCVYTEFATCLFPHEENRLPIKLEAGEKFEGH